MSNPTSAGTISRGRATSCCDHTDTDDLPWHIVRSDDKRRARLNAISHILSLIPYKPIDKAKVKLPERSEKRKYDDKAPLEGRRFIDERY